jgi:hypothetical protein
LLKDSVKLSKISKRSCQISDRDRAAGGKQKENQQEKRLGEEIDADRTSGSGG